MTDDLLDEATRLADRLHDVDPPEVRVLRALVERVQQGEREADKLRTLWEQSATPDLIAERDEARGKLDKVRAAVQSGAIVAESDLLLAILDGKKG